MKNGKQILGWALGIVALGVTVFVASYAWKKGQQNKNS
jgi:ABC-type uncharacterized transport system permease subunit